MEEQTDLPDFSGCLVLVNLGVASTKDRGTEAWLLEFPAWQVIGGRLFLKGRLPEILGNEWIAGRDVSVAWDSVTSFVQFASREQYKEHAARHKPTLREKYLS